MLALTALTILAALAQAAPCEPSSSASPTPSPTGKPPVSYTGRPIYWNYNLQKAMTVHGEIKAGAPVGFGQYTGSAGQLWNSGPPLTVGEIKIKDTNLCLDAGDYPATNGRKLTLQPCGQGGAGAQTWWYPNGKVELASPITHAHSPPGRSGQCIDLTDGRQDDGVQLQTWTCYSGNANQVWDLGPWCVHC